MLAFVPEGTRARPRCRRCDRGGDEMALNRTRQARFDVVCSILSAPTAESNAAGSPA